MGISTTSARNFRMQEFTTSGTWTAPAGTDLVEVILVGSGGGGGGGGAGACSTRGINDGSGNARNYGGNGGGGGGAGEYLRRLVRVVPGTTYNVTVGAGGTGGQIGPALQSIIVNMISNPGFETNTTGWSPVTGTLIRQTATIARGVASGQITASGTTASWRFDSGQASGASFLTGNNPRTFFTLRRASNAATCSLSATAEFFNSSNVSLGTMTSNTFTVGATANTFGLASLSFSNPIPAGANRVVITYTLTGTAASEVFQFDLFTFAPSTDFSPSWNFLPSSWPYAEQPFYIDPDLLGGALCWWSGTSQNSFTVAYNYSASRGVSEVASPSPSRFASSMAGAAGANGGNSSFGSLLSALGGQGGQGGDSGARRNSSPNLWPVLTVGRSAAGGPFANGGGCGTFATVGGQYDPANGGGGGSYKGWNVPYINGRTLLDINNQMLLYTTALPLFGNRGSRGSAGMFSGFNGSRFRYAGGLDDNLTFDAQYQSGGEGVEDGSCFGGGGGTAGGENTFTTTTTGTTAGSARVSYDKGRWPSSNYGDGGSAGAPATSNGGILGAGFSGTNGGNGLTPGSGGGGGGGGGPSANTAADATRGALSGSGGAGGNGADGYCVVMWWEG